MPQNLNINNFGKLNVKEKAELNADVAAAATAIVVSSNKDFAANDFAVIGRLAGESSEKVTVGGVTTDVGITVSALKFAHTRYEEVTSLFGDQIRIYSADNVDGTTPADGSFSLLTTVDIDTDQQETSYTDAAGGEGKWYKITYYNSLSTNETALTDSTAVRGGGYGNYASIESIRGQAGLINNRNITDARIEEKRQAAQSLINSTLTGRYAIPFVSPINPLIAEITRLLSAGYLLTQEFGQTSTSTYREGQEMLNRVTNIQNTGILDKLNVGTLTLQNAQGISQESSTSSNYNGWPNATTETASADDGGGVRGFRISDRY